MSKQMNTIDRQIARNSLLNLAGQGLPLIVGLFVIPFVVRHMSPERFGLLSLIWALLGTFALFNFGLSRATTKYVAEYMAGKTEHGSLSSLVWTSFWLQIAISAALAFPAALSLKVLLPFLKVSPSMSGEVRDVFLLLIASIPIIVGVLAWRGVLEGAGRFDLVNYVRGPQVAAVFLIPAIVIPFGLGLRVTALLLILVWTTTGILYAAMCLKSFPSLRTVKIDPSLIGRLAIFGGWITISNFVSPAFVYFDRFLIGALVSLAAVGLYAAPFEITMRLTIIPSSLGATLFPAFSALNANNNSKSISALFNRSLKYLFFISGSLVLILVCGAHLFLRLWLGAEFAAQGTVVLQLLSLSVLVNSLAYIPLSFLQSVGRPDLPSKFNMFELPLYLVGAYFLVRHFGINGAALASLLRTAADTSLLFFAANRALHSSRREEQLSSAETATSGPREVVYPEL
jgi:O-antigen/teichoic acid export membrane protein